MLPRTSVEVGYFWRWFHGFAVTDNLAVSPADFDQFSVTAPSDPRLPGGGGYTVSGLYNVKPAFFGIDQQLRHLFGQVRRTSTRSFNGLDITVEREADAQPDDSGRLQRREDRPRTTARSGRSCRRPRCSIRTATS